MSTKFLITGATGSTGGEVARQLLEAGAEVRAFVHRDDGRSLELRSRGAEVVIGDLRNFDAVRRAMKGIQRAYFCYPISPGIVQSTAQFAQASKEADVDFIVNMSQISARSDSKSEAARQHWLAERVFDWSGVPVAHIRPTFFTDWLLYLAPMIRQGVMRAPFGREARHAPISAEDQARVIVGLLREPDSYKGKTLPLYGPVELTHPEMAAIVARVIGRPVVYEQTPMAAIGEMLGATPAPRQNTAAAMYRDPDAQGGRPDFLTQHLNEVAIDHANGLFAGLNDHVAEIGGQPPLTVEAFVEKHRRAFEDQL